MTKTSRKPRAASNKKDADAPKGTARQSRSTKKSATAVAPDDALIPGDQDATIDMLDDASEGGVAVAIAKPKTKTRTKTKTSAKSTTKSVTKSRTTTTTTKSKASTKKSTSKTSATKAADKKTTPTGDEAAAAKPKSNIAKTTAAKTAKASADSPVTSTAAKRQSARKRNEEKIRAVWVEYKGAPSEELRNRLIENYLDLVRYTAERMHMRLPGEVDVEDLMSAGLFGLMDAIDAFDLERGVKFETYCSQRIRGAIFDELRAMDWVPRLVRSRTAKVERVRKSLEMELGRKATDPEIVERLAVSKDEFEKLQRDSRPVGVVSLDRKWYETDSSKDVREIDVIKDKRQENPLSELQRNDLKFLITKGLSRAERLIVVLYYYEEMTMKEIGMTLDLSESRVSQMHSSILARLKAQMQHRAKEL